MAHAKGVGTLVVIEGPDGVGKSSVCAALARALHKNDGILLHLTLPGKELGTIGELVYRVHHDPVSLGVNQLSPLSMQTLHVAAHIDTIERQIVPALAAGRLVLLDRFWWSVWVYGAAAGCDRVQLRALIDAEQSVWGSIRPELAVLLRRPSPIERDIPLEHWQNLAREYEALAEVERASYEVVYVDNSISAESTANVIVGYLPHHKARPAGQTSKAKGGRPTGFPAINHIAPVKPSVVFDTYWRFAAERQRIFFERLEGKPPPWTADPILAAYKFTNVYRASDRVSQYLIRHVIYRDDLPRSSDEVFFRIMIFKLFNKIETWESLESAVGSVLLESYSFQRYDNVFTRLMQTGSIYSAAYIMPSGGRDLGHDRKHRNHLALLERMVKDGVPRRLSDCPRMQDAFELLKSYPTIGDFLAYQFVTDLNYSNLTDFREAEFVVPGPGALDGIRKCFVDLGGLNEPELIRFVADRQELEFQRLGLEFRSLWGRRLMLIDCQNLFCEVDKYARVRHPDVVGLSGRSRIKQRFGSKGFLPPPWFPPKWNLNQSIDEWQRTLPTVTRQTLYPSME